MSRGGGGGGGSQLFSNSRCAYGKMASFYALFFEKGFDGDPRTRHAATVLAIVFCGVF